MAACYLLSAMKRAAQIGAIVLEFEEDAAGAITGVSMLRGGGERIPWSRR
jgi:hypothetical protein